MLVVGHSSGAYLAVSLMADLLRERVEPGPALSLLTLGHVVPMAAFLPDAGRLRDDLGCLARSGRAVLAGRDGAGRCLLFRCCAIRWRSADRPASDQRWPLVISAAFTHTLSPRAGRPRWKNRWFKLHFQ